MKTAAVSIWPGKWATVSFAPPVIVAPRRGRMSRNDAAAGRWDACKEWKGIDLPHHLRDELRLVGRQRFRGVLKPIQPGNFPGMDVEGALPLGLMQRVAAR